jgi:hypothetical protein
MALDQADGFEHGITSVNVFIRFYLTNGSGSEVSNAGVTVCVISAHAGI